MKSALREIRHIAAIPGLADPMRGEWAARNRDETKSARVAASRRRRRLEDRASAAAALDPEVAPYLLGRQHDAIVTGAEREGDRFTLIALDEDLGMLAGWKYGLDRHESGPPFRLVFEGVGYVGWREELRDGRLRATRAPDAFPFTEWGNDTLIEPESPGVRWAMRMHHQRYEHGHFVAHATIVILVEAERMRVVGPDRDAWEARFGPEMGDVFDRYQAVRAEVSLSRDPARLAEFGVEWPGRPT